MDRNENMHIEPVQWEQQQQYNSIWPITTALMIIVAILTHLATYITKHDMSKSDSI